MTPSVLGTPGASHGPRGQTGAAASSAAAAEAIRALVAIVRKTLGDPTPRPTTAPPASGADARQSASSSGVSPLPAPPSSDVAGGGGTSASSGTRALAALEQLAHKAAVAKTESAAEREPGREANGHGPGGKAKGAAGAEARRRGGSKPPEGFTGRFRVARDAQWRAQSAERLGPLLAQALPPLCAHPGVAVRAALSRGDPEEVLRARRCKCRVLTLLLI